MNSGLYEGWVRHRRHAPKVHAFTYRTRLLLLDLDELASVAGGRLVRRGPGLVRFRRRDYLGPEERPLEACVRDLVEERLGWRPEGRILMATHVRTLGFVFNPVTFYYCMTDDGDGVQAIVAHITNTPWGERHAYVLAGAPDRRLQRFRLRKDFHVSPFMPMDQSYDWRFSSPGRRLLVHMITSEAGAPRFDATLALERRPLTGSSLRRTLLRHPFETYGIVAGIYWNAFRLWRKRVPFHAHPRHSTSEALSP